MVYDDGGLYKVGVGAFLNMDYAVRMERTLRRNLGYPTVLVRGRLFIDWLVREQAID